MTERIRSSATLAATAFVGAALVLSLAACSNITNVLQRQHEESYSTFAQAAKDWAGVTIPAWIPDDATDLHNLATSDETVSVIRVTSESDPDGDCTTEDRSGSPALTADWSTDSWPDTVTVCGDYEIMPIDGGWLGWFTAQAPGGTPSAG